MPSAFRRGENLKTAVVLESEALQQIGVHAIEVAGQLVEAIVMVLKAKVERRFSQLGVMIDEKHLLAALGERVSQMNGESRGADATFDSHKRDELALDGGDEGVTLFARELNERLLDAVV